MKISTQAGRGRATRYVNVVCTGDHVEAAHSYAPVSLARSPATKSIAVDKNFARGTCLVSWRLSRIRVYFLVYVHCLF